MWQVADMSYLAALLPAIGHDPLDPRLARVSVGARPVHLIITMITWIRTSKLSIKNSLSHQVADMSYLAALLPAIGHDPLDPRLAMRFTVVGIDYPDTETMQVIEAHRLLYHPD